MKLWASVGAHPRLPCVPIPGVGEIPPLLGGIHCGSSKRAASPLVPRPSGMSCCWEARKREGKEGGGKEPPGLLVHLPFVLGMIKDGRKRLQPVQRACEKAAGEPMRAAGKAGGLQKLQGSSYTPVSILSSRRQLGGSAQPAQPN